MWINKGIIYESYEDIKRCLKYTSMPEEVNLDVLHELEFYYIIPTEPPDYNRKTQYIIPTYPKEIDGQYFQQWAIIDYTPEEIKARKSELKLNRLELKISLYNNNLLYLVEDFMKQASKIRQIQWADQAEFNRNSDFILWLIDELSIDEVVMDTIFEDKSWN